MQSINNIKVRAVVEQGAGFATSITAGYFAQRFVRTKTKNEWTILISQFGASYVGFIAGVVATSLAWDGIETIANPVETKQLTQSSTPQSPK